MPWSVSQSFKYYVVCNDISTKIASFFKSKLGLCNIKQPFLGQFPRTNVVFLSACEHLLKEAVVLKALFDIYQPSTMDLRLLISSSSIHNFKSGNLRALAISYSPDLHG